jgi:hypothetical protein
MRLTLADFEQRIAPAAADLEDRSLRYISSPQDHDLAAPTIWPLIYLQLFALATPTRRPRQ